MNLPLTDKATGNETENTRDELPRGNECIFVAEDDAAILEMVKELPEDYGYMVYAASNGAEAIDIFIKHQDEIDLILTDAIMPQGNGREVYQKINSIKPHLPAIFISGYPADLLAQRGRMENNLNYLSKPKNPSTLLIKIRDVLRQHHASS